MKNILIASILFIGVQLHAENRIVKFVDARGHDPQEHNHDQHCWLVDCADNTAIPDNNVILAVGDTLHLELPKQRSIFSDNYFAINNGDPTTAQKLHVAEVTGPGAKNNIFKNTRGISFDAVEPGAEELNIYFAENYSDPSNPNTVGDNRIDGLLGHITITVIK